MAIKSVKAAHLLEIIKRIEGRGAEAAAGQAMARTALVFPRTVFVLRHQLF
ncbi:hypothetical protein [Pectobacterium wasabiae]|uniref:hypothetical protein n=1 Tax=Pectobacterium wasabiae TaxID=55208 RepID=UPI003B84AED6